MKFDIQYKTLTATWEDGELTGNQLLVDLIELENRIRKGQSIGFTNGERWEADYLDRLAPAVFLTKEIFGDRATVTLNDNKLESKIGTARSGNWGHTGRPGTVGGSEGRGGASKPKIEEPKPKTEKPPAKKPKTQEPAISKPQIEEIISPGRTRGITTADKFFSGVDRNNRSQYAKRVAEDLGVDAKHATKICDSLEMYSSEDFSAIRSAQTGKVKNKAAETKGKLIDEYVDKAPKFDGEAYRGIRIDNDKVDAFMATMKKGAVIDMQGSSSWTADASLANDFAGAHYKGQHTPIVFTIAKPKSGSSISHLSTFEHEKEILFHSKAQYKVVNSVVKAIKGNKVTFIELEDMGYGGTKGFIIIFEEAKGETGKKMTLAEKWEASNEDIKVLNDNEKFMGAYLESKIGTARSGNWGHGGRQGARGGSTSNRSTIISAPILDNGRWDCNSRVFEFDISAPSQKAVPGRELEDALEMANAPDVIAARLATRGQISTHHINTPEREEIRIKAAADAKIEGGMIKDKNGDMVPIEIKHDKQVWIVMGPPGAGKTSTIVDSLKREQGTREIDSDIVNKYLPEYKDGGGAGLVHVEAKDIAVGTILPSAMRDGENIAFPIVGKDINTVKGFINEFNNARYKVHLVLVDIPPAESAMRAIERFREDNRYVEPKYILEEVGTRPRENYAEIIKNGGIVSHEAYTTNFPKNGPVRSRRIDEEFT